MTKALWGNESSRSLWCNARLCIFMVRQKIANTEKHIPSTKHWRKLNKKQPWPSGSLKLTEREKWKLLFAMNERTNGALCLESWGAGIEWLGFLKGYTAWQHHRGWEGICTENITQEGLSGRDNNWPFDMKLWLRRKKWRDTRVERSSEWKSQMAFNTVPQPEEQPQRHFLN